MLTQGAPQGKLPQGDLRLVALALIAEAPRHGYEIIKIIEEKTAEWYSPSPNSVYPILSNLAQEGYLTASPDPPRLYTITDEGRTYIQENREPAEAVLSRLTALGERVTRWRQARGAAGQRVSEDDSAESLVEILARAADHSQRK
jgi:DNA-binding PadR family transcriptional regulator